MGTLVTAADRSNTKPNYTLATVAAGSVVPTDGNYYVFVGATVPTNLQEFANVISHCRQALREADWPNPATTTFSSAVYNCATDALTVANGAAPTLTENDVAVIQGFDFSAAGVSNSAHTKRMIEKFQEEVAKVA